MTLIEMVVVMAIIAVLLAVLTPYLSSYVEQARVARAQSDARTIGEAISRFEKDVGRYPMFTSGSGTLPDSSANVLRLDGPGSAPSEAVATAWTTVLTDADCSVACNPSALTGQLLLNLPAYPQTTSLAKPFKWKGPYVDVQADPWANRYMVNIINAKSGSADSCFVLSAGPNGSVETAFNIPENSAISAGGDDIIYRIK